MGSHVAPAGLELTAILSLLHIPSECCCVGVHPPHMFYMVLILSNSGKHVARQTFSKLQCIPIAYIFIFK